MRRGVFVFTPSSYHEVDSAPPHGASPLRGKHCVFVQSALQPSAALPRARLTAPRPFGANGWRHLAKHPYRLLHSRPLRGAVGRLDSGAPHCALAPLGQMLRICPVCLTAVGCFVGRLASEPPLASSPLRGKHCVFVQSALQPSAALPRRPPHGRSPFRYRSRAMASRLYCLLAQPPPDVLLNSLA